MSGILQIAFFVLAAAFGASAATPVNPALLDAMWPASWIAHPTASSYDYGVFHFRKQLDLSAKPMQFVVHVSADNRYRLFVNGQFVASGPAQGDLRNWRFETVDLAPYLKPGSNVLAAVVWNGGEYRPMAQISHRTGFLLQGDTELEKAANTDASWKVIEGRAYQQMVYRDVDERLGWQYYVAGALERVDAKLYPWGWEKPGFDDSAWLKAKVLDRAAPAGIESHQKWQLVPRPVPLLFEREERSRRIARATGVQAQDAFLAGQAPIRIPAYTTATLLIDHGRMTTGYPLLRVSGGRGGEIRITYTEALYDAKGQKGNRDQLEGKKVIGVSDVFLPDGGAGREFRPLWVRSFRFVQLEVKTGADPITLDDFEHFLTGYPAERQAEFESDSELLSKIWNIGWRTLALGAQDTFVSDLAWERIQYVGDTQIHALAWLVSTGDDRLVRQALEQFDQSRAPFGLTQSRYPADLEQFTPLYSLVWINMVHDYWMYRADDRFVKGFLPGIREVLAWYERQLNADDMIPPLFQLDFVDSDYGRRWNEIAHGSGSRSMTIHTVHYAWALEHAAELFEHFGMNCEATRYRELSAKLKQTVRERCYDSQRGLFADTPDRCLFSQQANILAVAAGAVPPAEGAGVLKRTLSDSSLLPIQLYFRFFLARAMKTAGLADLYIDTLKPWSTMIDNGMTTFGEAAGNPRSECHPWSASPNYDLLATVAGIEPGSPGFRTVRIAPALGPLQRVHAKYPHPLGMIDVNFIRKGGQGLTARVSLPKSLEGDFVWNGRTRHIKGVQTLELE